MRIVLYTSTALPKLGGQEAVVDALARQFTRLGHRAVVLAPRPRLPLRPRDHDLPYPVYRHPRFYSTQYFVGWYRGWLRAVDRRERLDVLHCHDVYPTGYVASLCRGQIKAPLVITSHGGDVKAGNIRISKPGMQSRYVRAIQSADALISIGRFTEEGFRALVPSPPPISTIPNGIELEPYATPAPRPASLDPAIRPRQYVLFLGRLKQRKGVDLLLDALAQLPSDGVIRLVIAGTGEEESAIDAQVARLGLRDRVRRVGRVDGSDKVYLLQNALCTVMPSRVWEAFPLVLLESFAAGRPVLGTSVPGIVDLVQERKTGLLIPEGSTDALATALRTVFDDPQQADEMGLHARDFAQSYSWDAVARQHLALYESLFSRGRA